MSNIDSQSADLPALLKAVRRCTICQVLPLGPKPILQCADQSKILIAGQAPGRITHHKGVPFDDPSGVRLREWMGISRDVFYNPHAIALLPMGFCFPGAGKNGDLPPRPECAHNWRLPLLRQLQNIELTLIIGLYAVKWHIEDGHKKNLTHHVAQWQNHLPTKLVLPHPSPRNNRWLKTNPWFEEDVLPQLRSRITEILSIP